MVSIAHVFSSPIADGTNTQLVRPSDWNSQHAFTLLESLRLGGNTAGVVAVMSSGDVTIAGGNNITLSQNGNAFTISAAAQSNQPRIQSISAGTTQVTTAQVVFSNANGVSFGADGQTITASVAAQSAQPGIQSVIVGANTVSTGAVVFSNANGVSFGLNGSTVTATVKTDYLTTAMASNRGSDFVQALATIAGTSISGTIASNVISLSVGPYLTTAMASNRGSDFVQAGAVFAGTSASGTIASGGISVSIGPYLTTAMQSQSSSVFAKTGFTSTTTGDTAIVATLNTNGLSMGVPAFLTTAMQSNAATISNIKVSAGTSSANLSALTFADSNGVSFGLNNSVVTASVPVKQFWYRDGAAFGIASGAQANSSVSIVPMELSAPLVASRMRMVASLTPATAGNNSTAWISGSISAVLYSRNVSTLSSILSGSNTFTGTYTSNALGSFSGLRFFSLSFATTTLSVGDYWWAVHMSTVNTGGTGANTTQLGQTLSMQVQPNAVTGQWAANYLGNALNATVGPGPLGAGIISTGATLDSIDMAIVSKSGSSGNAAMLNIEVGNFGLY